MTASNFDTRGMAFVGMTLAQAILAGLRAKGILSDEEADEVLDTALSSLESSPSADPVVKQARALLEEIMNASKDRK
jgi:hypothetical protein